MSKRIPADQISEIRLRYACGEGVTSIARVVGRDRRSVKYCVHGADAKHATKLAYLKRYRDQPERKARTRVQMRQWRELHRYDDQNARIRRGKLISRLCAYGITEADYNLMFKQQEGKCAICGRADSGTRNGRRLSVDHDHSTNEVRGLLCQPCNQGLGAFRDNLDSLKAAIQYLEKYVVI